MNISELTIDELADEVARRAEEKKKGPTHIADIALLAANMDIHKVMVHHNYAEYPKTLYQLQPAKGRRPAKVLTVDVTSKAQEDAKVKQGWSLARLDLPVTEEDEEAPLSDEVLKKMLGSSDPIALPVGRRPGRPRKFDINDAQIGA